MRLSLVLQAIDRATGPTSRVGRAIRTVGSILGTVGRAAQAADRGLARFLTGGRRLDGLASMARRLGAAMRRAARETDLLAAAGRRVGNAIGWSARKIGAAALGLAKWGAAAGAAAGVAGLGFLTRGVISTASQFEQFQVVLENTEGSAEKARSAMRWVQKFAAITPYELSEVMQSFVALKAYGIDPTNGSLEALGNMAAGMGKPMMQAIEALADAVTGETERLKEFGIRASKSGDTISFSYRKAGKDITRTVKATGAEIERTLTSIASDRFAGMMERQSKTLAGMWSNLQDQVAGFQLDIADAGFFDVVKGKLQQLLDWIGAAAKDGRLEAWAKRISAELSTMVERAAKFIEGTDWGAVITGVGAVAGGFIAVAAAIGRAVEALGRWNLESERQTQAGIASGWFTSSGDKAAARARLRVIDDQLAGRDGKRLFGRSADDRTRDQATQDALARGAGRQNRTRLFRQTAPAHMAPLPRHKRWQPDPATPFQRGQGPQKLSAINGKVSVEVKLTGPGAKGARIDRVASTDPRVPVTTKLGPAMGRAA